MSGPFSYRRTEDKHGYATYWFDLNGKEFCGKDAEECPYPSVVRDELNAAFAAGREAERAEVVKWLREKLAEELEKGGGR